LRDEKKTKAELIRELRELRARAARSVSRDPECGDPATGPVPRQEMLEVLFSSMDEGVVMITPDGQIVEANPAAERILGLTHEEIKSSYSTAPLKTFDVDGNPLPRENGAVLRAMRDKRPVRDVEIGIQRLDGSMVWIRSSAEPLLTQSGELDCVVGTFVDITARHDAVKALRQNEERFREQFRGIPIPTYVWRREGDDLVLR